ncbi:MAG: erythromycin esterase family protein [Polyangiaceae bacterium]
MGREGMRAGREVFVVSSLISLLACREPEPRATPAAPDGATTAAVSGIVWGPNDRPVADALVALVREVDLAGPDADTTIVRTDARGAFSFSQVAPGHYAVTATAPALAAGYGGVFDVVASETRSVSVRLGADAARFSGVVRDERGPVVGATVEVVELSPRELSTFATTTDARGLYEISLAPGTPYLAHVAAPPRMRTTHVLDPHETSNDLVLEPAPAPRPSDDTLRAYLAAHVMPVSTDDPSAPSDDLAPIGRALGRARLIAIGEATHGSREIFRMRHRLLAHLVEHEGVTVFGLEAGYAECRALDAYVQGAPGNPRALLRGLITNYLETEEWVDLLEWMRRYNADPKHTAKVRFEGFDVVTFTAVREVVAATRSLSEARSKEVEAALAPLSNFDADATFAALEPAVRERTRTTLRALRGELASARDADVLAHDLDILEEACEVFENPLLRDRALERNVDWLVRRYPGERVVLSMHDTHAAKRPAFASELGERLARRYGDDYVVIGTAFGSGGFRALGAENEMGILEHRVGAPPAGTFEHALALDEHAVFALDLRSADGPVGAWLAGAIKHRSVGFRFVDETSAMLMFAPKASYDIVLFLRAVTPARPLAP